MMHQNQLHLALEYQPVQFESQKIGLKCLKSQSQTPAALTCSACGVTQVTEQSASTFNLMRLGSESVAV